MPLTSQNILSVKTFKISEHWASSNFFWFLQKKSVPKFKIILANKTWIVLLHFASYVSLGHYSVYALSEVDAHKCPIVWLSWKISQNSWANFSDGDGYFIENFPNYLNPFIPNAPFFYLLKTSENRNVWSCFLESRERVHWKQKG